ncbi:bifunctional riboflavin kinase/FAD synthetase [Verrucomicrobiota bacterium sgz303538]
MLVLRSIPELARVPGPVFLAIGVFDGVHLGHRAVIERACRDAKAAGGTAVVVSFDPHPIRVLRPEHAPRILTSTQHKTRLIGELGVEHLLLIPFDKEFASLPPEQFIRQLADAAQPLREICVGHQWSFGKGRAGNLDLLRTLGDELGFDEVGVEAVCIEGEIVSSTLIRKAVQAGDLIHAARLLGRDYSILGTVVRGDQIGRKIGFPTANLSAHNEQFPPNGVYAVDAVLGSERLKGVVNIGVRPTIAHASGERLLELHLFDFSRDIYAQDIEVFFRGFIRPERKFAGLDELKAQIARDAEQARAILAG